MISANKLNMSTGVTFRRSDGQQYHTYRNFSLFQLRPIVIEPAKPKTHLIDVPGMNGVLDVTSHFGATTFENRKITLLFESRDINYSEWETKRSQVATALDGQYCDRITLDTDPNYYWKGRVSVSSNKSDKFFSTIQIEIDAYPKKINSSGGEFL